MDFSSAENTEKRLKSFIKFIEQELKLEVNDVLDIYNKHYAFRRIFEWVECDNFIGTLEQRRRDAK